MRESLSEEACSTLRRDASAGKAARFVFLNAEAIDFPEEQLAAGGSHFLM